MDKLERVIKKSLIEQGTLAKAIKMAKGPIQGATTGDPMAHLAGKSVPALSSFSKEVQKAKSQGAPYIPADYNPSYNSSSPGTWTESDFASMNKGVGLSIDIAPMWRDTAAYNELIRLGGRPFFATKGQTQVPWAPITRENLEKYKSSGETLPGGLYRGIQIVMYNHPDHQVGMFVYFFENPNKMTFPHSMYNSWKYVDWKFEKSAGSAGSINLYRGGQREGWIKERFPGSNEITFVDNDDPGLKNIMVSDWIQKVRDFSPTFLQTAFKSNEPSPYVINIPGLGSINATALADKIQAGLDWVGIAAPIVDPINAAWYAGRGRYVEAAISIIGMVPFVGDAFMLILRPFGKAVRSAGGFTKELWAKLFNKLRAAGFTDKIIVKAADSSPQIIQMMRKTGLLTQQQADEMLLWLKNWKEQFTLYVKDIAATKAAALQRKQISKRIGVAPIEDATTELAKKSGYRSAFKKTTKLITDIPYLGGFIKGVAKVGWSWFTNRSKLYWKGAYTIAVKQFKRTLYDDPTKLAVCINTFVDKNITEEIYQKLAREFVTKLTPLRTGTSKKYIWKEGDKILGEFTEDQILEMFIKDPTKMINAYAKKLGPDVFNELLDEIVQKAVRVGDVVNTYWTAFWSDPVRQFANEYFKGFKGARFAVGTADSATWRTRNWASDVVDGASEFLTTNDALKRLDIVYNELQEYLERHDYGDLEGKELNQQSVIYWFINEVYESIFGISYMDALDAGEAAIKKVIPVVASVEKRDGANVFPYGLDSTVFQPMDTRQKGGLDYKRSWMASLVKNKIVSYNGGNTSQWTVLRDSPYIIINGDLGSIKKGQVIELNKQTGIMDIVTNPKLVKYETDAMNQWKGLANKLMGNK